MRSHLLPPSLPPPGVLITLERAPQSKYVSTEIDNHRRVICRFRHASNSGSNSSTHDYAGAERDGEGKRRNVLAPMTSRPEQHYRGLQHDLTVVQQQQQQQQQQHHHQEEQEDEGQLAQTGGGRDGEEGEGGEMRSALVQGAGRKAGAGIQGGVEGNLIFLSLPGMACLPLPSLKECEKSPRPREAQEGRREDGSTSSNISSSCSSRSSSDGGDGTEIFYSALHKSLISLTEGAASLFASGVSLKQVVGMKGLDGGGGERGGEGGGDEGGDEGGALVSSSKGGMGSVAVPGTFGGGQMRRGGGKGGGGGGGGGKGGGGEGGGGGEDGEEASLSEPDSFCAFRILRNDSSNPTASSISYFDSDPVPGPPPAPEEKGMELDGENKPHPLSLPPAYLPSAAHLSKGLLQEAEGQLSPVPLMNDDILGVFDREEGQG